MKTPFSSLRCISLAMMLLCVFPVVQAHEFTDVLGRKLTGDLMAVDAGKATLKLASGKIVPVELSKFCAADQLYIQEWVVQSVKFSFEVKTTREKVGAAKKKLDDSPLGGLVGSVLKETEEKWVYKVTLRNMARIDATGITAKYWIFRREDNGKAVTAPTLEVSGEKPLTDMHKGASSELVTDPVTLNKTQLQGGFIYTDGTRSNTSDKMGGMVLRLFKEGTQIFEYATDDKLKAAAKDGAVAEKK